jgi:hypothetical protein
MRAPSQISPLIWEKRPGKTDLGKIRKQKQSVQRVVVGCETQENQHYFSRMTGGMRER